MRPPGRLDRRYGYHAARWRSRLARSLYAGPLAGRISSPPASPTQLAVHYIGFSGERDAPEQMASLRSFLRYVGRPAKVTLASDGTHTPRTLERLHRLYEGLEVVVPETYMRRDLPASVRRFASEHVSGLKLAFMLSLEPGPPVLYADSDVLFFPGASAIRDLLAERSQSPSYMVDCVFKHDERMLSPDLIAAPPVNSGFWILRAPLEWSEALALMDNVEGPFMFHTEQTVLHVAMHRGGGNAVDPRRYVLQVDDRFEYRTRRERAPIVLRHYVTGIRHQFWLNFAG